MAKSIRWLLVLLVATGCAGPLARAEGPRFDVRVDLKNVSGEVKTDWPVILRVYTVLGRNLPARALAGGGFRVTDPQGREVPCAVRRVPPLDQPGNDEIVFVVPRMAPGEVLQYRIARTPRPPAAAAIDVVGSPHNLLAGGGFETGKDGRPAGFSAPSALDAKVAHSGKSSLVLTADNATVSTRFARPVKLHKGSWYHFGVWSRTAGVSRYGHQAGSAAHFRLTGPDAETGKRARAFAGRLEPQCSTRDWLKVAFTGAGVDAWGMDRCAARALADEATVEFVLQQRRHFYMTEGHTRGTWWLDDAVLIEQPEVHARFDLAVKGLMTDGVFCFTRPPAMDLGRIDEKKRGRTEWCAYPYAHEELKKLDAFALKGQRVSFCVGVYHAREVKSLSCRAEGPLTLRSPAGAKAAIPAETIEYCPGYLGPDKRRYMDVVGNGETSRPVNPAGKEGVRYFFLTFRVPDDAPAGRYAGKVRVAVDGKDVRAVPVTLRVQDMAQVVPDDVFVGIIYQGSNPRFDEEGMTVYARSGFNCVTRFGSFFRYEKAPDGKPQIDLKAMHERMMWLKGHGMKAVCVFSDFDLGPKWNGGSLLKRVRPDAFNKAKGWSAKLKTAEKPWKAQIARIEGARKAHPEWPVFIYMTWDEPSLGGGRNGRPDPAMGWVNEVAPRALTTLDVQFAPLPVCLKWYTVPAFDDPANWAGPEVYRWVRKQGKTFGFCGAADVGEGARSQPGLLMTATGAKYFHAWHLTGGHRAGQVAYDRRTKKLLRAPAMINWADGMNDLKAHTLLTRAVADAAAEGRSARAVADARAYLKRFFDAFNGDYQNSWTLRPALGSASSWGFEGFYDDWQERMLRHAAAVRGVSWID